MSKSSDIKLLFIGVFLCEFSSSLTLFTSFSTYIRMLGVIIALIAFVRSAKYKIGTQNGLFTLLLIFTLFTLLRGSLIGNNFVYYESKKEVAGLYQVIRHIFLYPMSGVAFLVPFVCLIKFNLNELKFVKKVAVLCVVISSILLLSFYNVFTNVGSYGAVDIDLADEEYGIAQLMSNLCVGFGAVFFISLCFAYLKGWYYWIIPVFVFVNFITNLIAGSRGGSFSSLLYILIFLYFYFKFARKNRHVSKFLSLLFLGAVIMAFIYFIQYLYENEMFDYFVSRINNEELIGENNRTVYKRALINDLNSDPLSWIFGRGINGSFSFGGGRRCSMEWGWLWYILKGGLLYLITYVSILLRTFYLGFFKSNNVLCKAFGVFALVQFFSLLPFGLPQVDLWCLVIWLGVGVVNQAANRRMSDSEFYSYFN